MSIKLFVMDVDGTLTDGRIYIGAEGEVMKAFDVRDGYAIANILPSLDITPVIITGRKSQIVEVRAKEQGVGDKLAKLKEVAEKYNAIPSEIAYIGDDLNDLGCIAYCGLAACPGDAVEEVKKSVDYVCQHQGGRGAVREFVIYIFDQMQSST